MPRKFTWMDTFKLTFIAALIQPWIIMVGLLAPTAVDGLSGSPAQIIDSSVLRFFYLYYALRLGIPALIYLASPNNRTRGMLTHALIACGWVEALLATICIKQLFAGPEHEEFASLGPMIAIFGLIVLSVICQIIGMIVGLIRGFEREPAV